jgi:hypothetical protein
MAKVGSLWIGDGLGFVQRLCLTSFVYYGHEVSLYVYDMDMEVPAGVIKKNAEEIVPANKIFKHHGQLAAFSDYFRYKMIEKTDLMWVDADTLCLNKDFFEDIPFVFIKESDTLIAGGILKMPSDHAMTKQINVQANSLLPRLKSSSKSFKWAMLGPMLLTKMVNKFGLSSYAQPANLVNLLDHWSLGKTFWDPKSKDGILKGSEVAYCATFFTGSLRMQGFDTEQKLPKGSAIEYFAKKFGVSP